VCKHLRIVGSFQASSPNDLKASPSSKDASKTIMVMKSMRNARTLLEPIFFFIYCLNSNGLAFSIATKLFKSPKFYLLSFYIIN